jgi:hypothetical protein
MIPLPLMLNKQERLTRLRWLERINSGFSVQSVAEKYLYQFSTPNPVF